MRESDSKNNQTLSKHTWSNEIAGVICIGVGIFLIFGLYSYNPSDPSLTTITPNNRVSNLTGRAGAIISDLAFQIFGGGSYLLPVLFITYGVKRIMKREERGWSNFIGISLSLLSFPLMLHLYFNSLILFTGETILKGRPGGAIGKVFYTISDRYFATIGTHIIVLSMFIISILMTIPFTFVALRRLSRIIYNLINIQIEKKKKRKSFIEIIKKGNIEKEKPKIIDTKVEVHHGDKQGEFEFMKKGRYQLPPLSLLNDPPKYGKGQTKEELIMNSRILEKKLLDFEVEGRVVEVHPGPVITMYEYEPAPGVKINRIVNLSDDLALAMKAMSVRIVAPIPGKSVVGIEIPNNVREEVFIKDILACEENVRSGAKLKLAMGKDIFGNPVINELNAMPHLLVAGATGTGKSVGLNTMICSILFSLSPDEVKMVLIDPKMLELSLYDGMPHLLAPVITKVKEAADALRRVVFEMEQRYQLMADSGVRNIDGYNKLVDKNKKKGEDKSGDKMPYLIVIIDELADLMMTVGKDVEDSIARLAQMARAAGIHLILATQRPSVDVLTGVIKANFPARMSFQVSSKTDSRTILDCNGAEQLLGKGDMLFLNPSTGRITRIHSSYISEDEIKKVVDFTKKQALPDYKKYYDLKKMNEKVEEEKESQGERDELYDKAIDLVTTSKQASASLIQRRLRVGYPRAARMIEMMEEDGIVGPAVGGKQREILVRGYSEDDEK